MSDPATGRVVLAYAAAFAVLFVLLMVRGLWGDEKSRVFVPVGFVGLALSTLAALNTLSVGGSL